MTSSFIALDEREEKIARGERLKAARKMAGVTIKDMTADGFIKYNTVCAWESGKHSGLTEKGARKAIQKLDQLGVQCSLQWLLFGLGHPPRYKNLILQQVEWLKESYPNCVGCFLEDDAMSPVFKKGDYVAGFPLTKVNLAQLHQKYLIVRLEERDQLCVRQLSIEPGASHGQLCALNADNPSNEPIPMTSKLDYYLVSWHLVYDSFFDQQGEAE